METDMCVPGRRAVAAVFAVLVIAMWITCWTVPLTALLSALDQMLAAPACDASQQLGQW